MKHASDGDDSVAKRRKICTEPGPLNAEEAEALRNLLRESKKRLAEGRRDVAHSCKEIFDGTLGLAMCYACFAFWTATTNGEGFSWVRCAGKCGFAACDAHYDAFVRCQECETCTRCSRGHCAECESCDRCCDGVE